MRRRPWFRRSLAALVILVALSAGFSRSLRTGRVHGFLTARLEAAFGRPVEVGAFSFGLLRGLRLEAEYVTVGEDPRFGYEYFLRAERLAASLRWMSLLRGRFEFGTLALTRPSLNLVRGADGHWNVESWLPPPVRSATVAVDTAGAPPTPARLYRIEISSGRINFKLGPYKHPFALANVSGRVEQEAAGRWLIDLEARPMRAAVTLQEAGTLRLRGSIAGTSTRLQPAELTIGWQGVSLADALRLARGQDYGFRGRLMAVATARTGAPSEATLTRSGLPSPPQSPAGGTPWKLSAAVRLAEIHRWDLPLRPGDPALNLLCDAEWQPGELSFSDGGPEVEFSKCTLETPHSNAGAQGRIRWAKGFDPEFEVASTWLDWGDLLAWYRAFRPGVPESLALEGHGALNLSVRGWPPKLEGGSLTSEGARLRGGGLRLPLGVENFEARVRRGRLELTPTTLTFITTPVAPVGRAGGAARGAPRAGPAEALHCEVTIGPPAGAAYTSPGAWTFELGLDGQASHAEDWMNAARALGYTPYREWSIEGPAALRVRWRGSLRPFAVQGIGSVDLRGAQLRVNYLNQPIALVQAHIELQPTERRVMLAGAQAFGARWKGTFHRARASLTAGIVSAPAWEFDLSADRLAVEDLDRWLGPRARPSFLERLVPFAAATPDTTERDAALVRLLGHGRLGVDEVSLGHLQIKRLRAGVELAGRTLRIRDAEADFYKGTVRGELEAELVAQPVYRFTGNFDRVNLGLLGEATNTLEGRFAGTATGSLSLRARGVGRDELLRSLEGRGTLQFRSVKFYGLDVSDSYRAATLRAGNSDFSEAAASFAIAAQKVQIERLQMTGSSGSFLAQGALDFSRTVDLRLSTLASDAVRKTSSGTADAPSRGMAAGRMVRISGPLDALQIVPVAEPGKAAAKKK